MGTVYGGNYLDFSMRERACDFSLGNEKRRVYTEGMQLVVDDWESQAPVILHPPPMTDEEFVRFCERYPDHQIECSAEGEIIIMPPTYSEGSYRNGEVCGQLREWARAGCRGRAFDASCGFVLPNGARRSPDAAWVSMERIAALPAEHRHGFFHLAPEFLIELRSATDRLKKLQKKMEEWIANGTQLAWLIDPEERVVWIYRPEQPPERLENPERVTGEGPGAGFVLELAEVWAGV